MNKLIILFAFALVAITAASAQTYPKGTKVAIVPIINQSGDKWVELQERQIKAGHDWLATEFSSHGFTVVAPDTVAKAIADLKINFSDDEQQNRANLIKIGKRVGATLVIFPIIVASSQGTSGGLFPKRQGAVTIKLWLVDAVKQEPIINAVTLQGKASGSSFLTGIEKGSEFQVKAVGNTLKKLLKDWFKPYPIIGG